MDESTRKRLLNEMKREEQQRYGKNATPKSPQLQAQYFSAVFTVLTGWLSGIGVVTCGLILCLYLAKLLTGSYFDVWTQGFRPQPIFWITYAIVLGIGSMVGGYIAARLAKASRLLYGLLIGVLYIGILLLYREKMWICIIPPVCSVMGAAFVSPPSSTK